MSTKIKLEWMKSTSGRCSFVMEVYSIMITNDGIYGDATVVSSDVGVLFLLGVKLGIACRVPSFSEDGYSPVSTTLLMTDVRKLDSTDVAVSRCSAERPFMSESLFLFSWLKGRVHFMTSDGDT